MKPYSFLNSIEPDAEELVQVITRKGKQSRLHFLELFIDGEVKNAIFDRCNLQGEVPLNRDMPNHKMGELHRDILLYRSLGYDIFRVPVIRKDSFVIKELKSGDTAAGGQSRGERNWIEEHAGPIQDWEDFEAYPWPDIGGIDLSRLDWMEKNCPPGMGCFDLTAHILEIVTFLLGYETLCIKLTDDPELVEAMFEKVGNFYTAYTEILSDYSCMPLIWGADDFGFKSSTLLSPEDFRRHVFPWHKRCAEIAHRHGKPYILHSCGNLEGVMEDLITGVGIDGKHSYEDIIQPVTGAFRQYGDRISILGGMDVDFLCRSNEREIRGRVRDILEICMGNTGYCFGTGNSVANYIPAENYLIMLDEASRFTSS